MEKQTPIRIAVIGSGMAGLVTAHLLHHDSLKRYKVQIFESDNTPSLSAHVHNPCRSNPSIDVPMRVFSEGYYTNLRAMYDYLDITYHAQRFIYAFCTTSPPGVSNPSESNRESTSEDVYFTHASHSHEFPPPCPSSQALIPWVLEVVTRADELESETLKAYLTRIHVPEGFINKYLLPVMSSVGTCSFEEMLNFPAIDTVRYKALTTGQDHLVVADGVRSVERKLVQGIDIALGAKVVGVETLDDTGGVSVKWMSRSMEGKREVFDHVVLAVSPDVVGRVYTPLRDTMRRIPTTKVDCVLHTCKPHLPSSSSSVLQSGRKDDLAEWIYLSTDSSSEHRRTESMHIQCSKDMAITTSPLHPIYPTDIILSASFTRVLRTVDSRKIVNELFGEKGTSRGGGEGKEMRKWRNGDGNVWLVGGWCWDGMVLLEACVVSAMRIAESFRVEVPWRR